MIRSVMVKMTDGAYCCLGLRTLLEPDAIKAAVTAAVHDFREKEPERYAQAASACGGTLPWSEVWGRLPEQYLMAHGVELAEFSRQYMAVDDGPAGT